VDLVSPVEEIAQKEAVDETGVALCLSGGGYRAMLFHLGGLWRLNELGWLPKLTRVSSVSGGSITAAALALRWQRLAFDGHGVAATFRSRVVDRVRALADHTIDLGAIVTGLLTPGSIAGKVADAFREHLFGDVTLQSLPASPGAPLFVINASNVQTGALWRFSRPYMADYKVGYIPSPRVDLAVAVAASSAFPPVLSPLTLEIDPASFDPARNGPLHQPPYTTTAVLTDGGVYDNLGLETAWKRCRTVLVSDGGGALDPDPDPATDWARHGIRIASLIDSQVRSLRKRQVIASFRQRKRTGTYWGIRSHVADYQLPDAFVCPEEQTRALANVPTRLQRVDDLTQERLINWGYAIADTAMRRWVLVGMPRPAALPYPAAAFVS
jgi:NTE family protein